MTRTIVAIVAGGVGLLAWRWFHVWRSARLDAQAFEYRMRNRQDLK